MNKDTWRTWLVKLEDESKQVTAEYASTHYGTLTFYRRSGREDLVPKDVVVEAFPYGAWEHCELIESESAPVKLADE